VCWVALSFVDVFDVGDALSVVSVLSVVDEFNIV